MPKLTYATLEAEINKWAYQLEEQENIFIHQATQVNAWDRLLLESGDKVCFCPLLYFLNRFNCCYLN
jgi:nuclear pore complex protein Nup62